MGFIAIKGDKVAPQLGITPIEESKALGEHKKGDMGLFVGYTTVGLLGAGLAIAFFISSSVPFIGWIVVGLAVISLFVLAAWIERNKDNKVQEWLKRCHFGTHADKYQTEAEEVAELKKAFA